MAKSDSPAIEQKAKELREELAKPDMAEFDRMMRHLVNVPKSTIDRNEKHRKAKLAK